MSLTAVYAKKALIGEELQVLDDACILIEEESIKEITTARSLKHPEERQQLSILATKPFCQVCSSVITIWLWMQDFRAIWI